MMDWYIDALREAGVNVIVADSWWNPDPSYVWRVGHPEGAMWHHTATTAYTPNEMKANQWAGIWNDGRLYQDAQGPATLVLSNQGPAPISSGYGVRALLEDFVRRDVRFLGKQTAPDDSPQWAGNRSYWNTEVVLNGVGASMRPDVWEMCTTAAAVLTQGMGWSAWRNVGHLQHTRRKIDLYDGVFVDGAETMRIFQDNVSVKMEDDMAMNLERWATRLRNPLDFDQMAVVGIITEAERDYWVTVDPASPEMQDLRDAVEVRSPIWVG